jgi:DME family drug/metabolite transporter
MSPPLARIFIILAAVLFSSGGAAIKWTEMNNWQTAGFRSGFAALTVLALMPEARRGWTWTTLLVGASYAATMILFVAANKLTTAANTIFLQATNPLFILLISPWLLGEKVTGRTLALLAAVAVGMALFFVGLEAPTDSAPRPGLGNFLAIASGLSLALGLVGLRWIQKTGAHKAGSGMAAIAAANTMAFLFCMPFALPLGEPRIADWAVVGYLGIFQIGIAYILVTRGISRLGALETSLLLIVEPVLNPVWAWLVKGEAPGRWAIAGGAIILGATLIKTWLDARRPLPATP